MNVLDNIHLKKNWPKKEITSESLAKAGFYYLGLGDKVKWAFCGVIIYNWNERDDPLGKHIKTSPK